MHWFPKGPLVNLVFFLPYMPLWNTQLKRILPLYQCWYEHIVYQLLPWGQWYFTPFVNSIYIKTFSWCKVNHVVCNMLNRSWHFMLMKWTMWLTILSSKFTQQSTQQRSLGRPTFFYLKMWPYYQLQTARPRILHVHFLKVRPKTKIMNSFLKNSKQNVGLVGTYFVEK